jgi:hypothetical protein
MLKSPTASMRLRSRSPSRSTMAGWIPAFLRLLRCVQPIANAQLIPWR